MIAPVLYFGILLVALEISRRRFRLAPDVSRQLFHTGVAVWALPSIFLYESGADAAVPYLVVSAVAFLSFRYELIDAIEDDGASLGSVLLPLASAALLVWLWGERVYMAVAGAFAAGFGDTAAALVGRRTGSRKFRAMGHSRSMEGTLTLFLSSGLTMAPVLSMVGGLGTHQAVAFALIGATVAASVESVSVYGTDNLTVPVATAATLALLVRFSL